MLREFVAEGAGAWRAAIIVMMLAVLSGCVSFSQLQTPYEPLLRDQHYDAALKALESDYRGRNDRVLYALDKGALLSMKGDLKASNEVFEQAKRGMAKLEAISVSEQVSSTTVNDKMRRYGGAPFERLLVHVYKALNYLELGQLDEARVEVLQLDVLLKQLNDPPGSSFARYFSGVVFEAAEQWSDALIAYRKAYQAYLREQIPVPPSLQRDLLRLTRRQGLDDEYRGYVERFGREADDEIRRSDGEVILVLYSGLIPRKQEQAIMVQSPDSGRLIRVATPFYENRWPAVGEAQLVLAGLPYPADPVAALGQTAKRALEIETPAIIARAIARAAIKTAASRVAAQSDRNGELIGLLVNIVGVITEQADVRGWYTLPQAMMVAKVRLAPGEYPLSVRLVSAAGTTQRDFPPTQVEAGRTKIISLHWPVTGGVQWKR